MVWRKLVSSLRKGKMKFLPVLCLVLGLALASPPPRAPKYEDPNHGYEPGKFPRSLKREEDSPTSVIPEEPEIPDPQIDIFPPKWYPGDVIKKTGHTEVDQALDEVMRAGDALHDRRCAIGIANEAGVRLFNPVWAFYSGQVHTSMPYEFNVGHSSLNLFVKRKGMASGSVGVFTYDIDGTDYKVAVMWSVPFDFNIYDVWFNMKVYPRSVPTDENLWSHMYYDAGPWRTDSWRTREEFGVKLRATMTKNHHSKLIVWVDTTGFDLNSGYDLHTDCSYHPGWVGNHCTQECFAGGWCWVNKRCSSRSDCLGKQVCHSGC